MRDGGPTSTASRPGAEIADIAPETAGKRGMATGLVVAETVMSEHADFAREVRLKPSPACGPG